MILGKVEDTRAISQNLVGDEQPRVVKENPCHSSKHSQPLRRFFNPMTNFDFYLFPRFRRYVNICCQLYMWRRGICVFNYSQFCFCVLLCDVLDDFICFVESFHFAVQAGLRALESQMLTLTLFHGLVVYMLAKMLFIDFSFPRHFQKILYDVRQRKKKLENVYNVFSHDDSQIIQGSQSKFRMYLFQSSKSDLYFPHKRQ